jgi:hypothetical protein
MQVGRQHFLHDKELPLLREMSTRMYGQMVRLKLTGDPAYSYVRALWEMVNAEIKDRIYGEWDRRFLEALQNVCRKEGLSLTDGQRTDAEDAARYYCGPPGEVRSLGG